MDKNMDMHITSEGRLLTRNEVVDLEIEHALDGFSSFAETFEEEALVIDRRVC